MFLLKQADGARNDILITGPITGIRKFYHALENAWYCQIFCLGTWSSVKTAKEEKDIDDFCLDLIGKLGWKEEIAFTLDVL